MANRDFKKIERIMKDFSMGVGEGGGGTTVVANPELEGTEPDLTGLEVEGTKYKVPKQNSYYEHHVTLTNNTPAIVLLTIVNDDYHPFDDRNNIVNYLSSKGFKSTGTAGYESINAYPVSGSNYNGLFIGVTVYNGSLYPVENGSYGLQVHTEESLSVYKDIVNG